MSDEYVPHALGAIMAGLLAFEVVRKRFDPFAPVWLFLVGYAQVYIIQAVMLREWALLVRGADVVAACNFRALWGLVWFLAVYSSGVGKPLARWMPAPPRGWSVTAVSALCPCLIVWGFYCAWVVVNQGWGTDASDLAAETLLFQSFPFLMLVAGILLIVTGRHASNPKPMFLWAGLGVVGSYVMIWMFNGKRSHALIGVLSAVCAFYITRRRRPSWPVLFATAFTGALVVALAIGWRNNYNYERSLPGFIQYLGDFRVAAILESLNIEDEEESGKPNSNETKEYGGTLLMMDTVPEKSDYDYGANYLRCFSTYVPRIVWPDKPIYGRDKWIAAWQAGSEQKRADNFAGPAIGILGATQLNGGAVGTLIVLAALAVMFRAAYEYFLRYDTVPWIQAWWALTYYNAWFTTVNDDPMIWFYYNWGVTCLPNLLLLWVVNRFLAAPARTTPAFATSSALAPNSGGSR